MEPDSRTDAERELERVAPRPDSTQHITTRARGEIAPGLLTSLGDPPSPLTAGRRPAPPSQSRSTPQEDRLLTLQAPRFAAVLAGLGVRHGFSTRTGGVPVPSAASEAPGSASPLNLGFPVTPAPADEILDAVLEENLSAARVRVLANRARLAADVFDDRPMALVTIRQVHSADVYRVGTGDAGSAGMLAGDGLVTGEAGVSLGILTADCVPVLLADRRTGAIGAFHAGWRGTLAGIVIEGVRRMRREFGAAPADLVAAIGPAVGPCCYGVGAEVEAQFRARYAHAEQLFFSVPPEGDKHRQQSESGASRRPVCHLDLQQANRLQLAEAGLPPDSIEVIPYCTSCRTDLFFSYRAEHGKTGRMMALIGRC